MVHTPVPPSDDTDTRPFDRGTLVRKEQTRPRVAVLSGACGGQDRWGLSEMEKEEKDADKESAEQQQQLREKVVEAITRIQNDMACLRMLGSKHVWEGASDEIFDALEKAFVRIVRKGQPLPHGDEAYDVIGKIAWEGVTFLDKIAYDRLELDKLLKRKCAELVNGSPRSRHKSRRSTRAQPTK